MNAAQYFASYAKLAFWYLGQLVLPDGIVVIWATPVLREGVFWWLLLSGLCAGALVLCMVRCRGKRPLFPAFGLLWLVVGLLPLAAACLVEPTRGLVVEPYWLVFASLGFYIFLAQMLEAIYKQRAWIACVSAAVILIS